jgi:hypothetical protein
MWILDEVLGAGSMHVFVMEPAQQAEVVEISTATPRPGLAMVDLARSRWRIAPRPSTVPISHDDGLGLCR